MISEIQDLMEAHWKWLRDKTQVRSVGNQWAEITTPYLDRHNDMLQIYAKRDDHGFVLTDDGQTIGDLILSGCKLESPKRRNLLQVTLAGFGVKNIDERLEVHATLENFGLRKHSLIQAMLAVNDMFFLSAPMITSLFLEDVQSWLDTHDVRYTPKVKLTGKSGLDHLFEFVIPKSRIHPERVLQTINRPNRETVELLAFKWIDTRDVRSADAKAFAFLNDQEHAVSTSVIDAMRNLEIEPVVWSKRDEFAEVLAA